MYRRCADCVWALCSDCFNQHGMQHQGFCKSAQRWFPTLAQEQEILADHGAKAPDRPAHLPEPAGHREDWKNWGRLVTASGFGMTSAYAAPLTLRGSTSAIIGPSLPAHDATTDGPSPLSGNGGSSLIGSSPIMPIRNQPKDWRKPPEKKKRKAKTEAASPPASGRRKVDATQSTPVAKPVAEPALVVKPAAKPAPVLTPGGLQVPEFTQAVRKVPAIKATAIMKGVVPAQVPDTIKTNPSYEPPAMPTAAQTAHLYGKTKTHASQIMSNSTSSSSGASAKDKATPPARKKSNLSTTHTAERDEAIVQTSNERSQRPDTEPNARGWPPSSYTGPLFNFDKEQHKSHITDSYYEAARRESSKRGHPGTHPSAPSIIGESGKRDSGSRVSNTLNEPLTQESNERGAAVTREGNDGDGLAIQESNERGAPGPRRTSERTRQPARESNERAQLPSKKRREHGQYSQSMGTGTTDLNRLGPSSHARKKNVVQDYDQLKAASGVVTMDVRGIDTLRLQLATGMYMRTEQTGKEAVMPGQMFYQYLSDNGDTLHQEFLLYIDDAKNPQQELIGSRDVATNGLFEGYDMGNKEISDAKGAVTSVRIRRSDRKAKPAVVTEAEPKPAKKTDETGNRPYIPRKGKLTGTKLPVPTQVRGDKHAWREDFGPRSDFALGKPPDYTPYLPENYKPWSTSN
ncbi:hypothetical protein FKW77_007862 [Venturia effusa]|uniref:Uncharacterized protein n=1 Tax=Venturia effusa TaxID=50376 RepID=A0A517L9N0_9PEZI|nr:hypothetical protein FKW77_007862 [Venturia effusa]